MNKDFFWTKKCVKIGSLTKSMCCSENVQSQKTQHLPRSNHLCLCQSRRSSHFETQNGMRMKRDLVYYRFIVVRCVFFRFVFVHYLAFVLKVLIFLHQPFIRVTNASHSFSFFACMCLMGFTHISSHSSLSILKNTFRGLFASCYSKLWLFVLSSTIQYHVYAYDLE